MKRLVVVALVLLSAHPAFAWRRIGHSCYYAHTDGYIYSAVYTCNGYCYTRICPIPETIAAPTYSENWKDRVLAIIAQKEDRQAFNDSLAALGYPQQTQQTYQTSYGNAAAGFSVQAQGYVPGYVPGGQTVYGLASNVAVAQSIDVNAILHESQRLVDRTLGLAEMANNGATGLVAQAVDGNSKAAQIIAAGNAAAAQISAVNPPVTNVQGWKTQPQYPAQPNQPPVNLNPPQGQQLPADQRPPPPPQPESTTDKQSVHNQAVLGSLALSECIQCHSGPTAKGDLRLSPTAIAQLSPEDKAKLRDEIAQRTAADAPADKRMPKNRPALPAAARAALLAMLG